MKKKFGKGFTLVELVIVIAIVGILAALIVSYLVSQISKGYDANRKSDLDRIKIALEEYEKDHNCYPSPSLLTCLNGGTGLQPYLNQIPCDPVTHASYFYEYEDSTCSTWWRLYTKLDNSQDPNIMALCGGPDNKTFNYYISSPNAPGCVSTTGTGSTGGTGSDGGGVSSSTPPPGVTGKYFGCISGACSPIQWDPQRPGPECDPNYQNSNCYSQCGLARNMCRPWK